MSQLLLFWRVSYISFKYNKKIYLIGQILGKFSFQNLTFQGSISSDYILSIYTDILKDLPANNQSNEINLNNIFYFYIPIYFEKCKSGQFTDDLKFCLSYMKSLFILF